MASEILTAAEVAKEPRLRVRRLISAQNLIIAGVLVVVAYLTLVPLGFLVAGSLRTSLFTAVEEARWTLDNYVRAYTSRELFELLGNSTLFAVGAAAVALAIGTALAWITERTNTPARWFISALLLVPLIIPGILNTISWVFLLSPKIGLVNRVLMSLFGLENPPFNAYSLPGMMWVEGLHLAPMTYLLMVAAFQYMDPAMEEAAQVSGARPWQTLRRITLRLAWPSIFAALLIAFVRSLEAFEVPAILGLPVGIRVFTSRIYQALHQWPADFGLAGAYAMTLLAVTSLGIYLHSRITRQQHRYVTVTGKGYKPAPLNLGRWRYLTLAVVVAYFAVAVVLPLFVLLWSSFQPYYNVPSLAGLKNLTLKNYDYVLTYPKVMRSASNSLLLGVGSASLVMLLTAIVSWLTIKTKIRARWLADNLAFLPLIVPGLVMGVALVYVYLILPVPIYGTLWILLVAYVTRYMPYGMRYNSASMVQLSGELEESAYVAGASWWRTFRSITLPLLKPGFLAGWTYVFVVSFRELSSSILLYGPGSEVMSITIWEFWQNGQYTPLSAMAVLMIVALFVVVTLTRVGSRRAGVRT